MLYWFLLANNAPAFFPEWFQVGVYGFTLGAGILGGAYTYHITLLRDDIKRRDETINNLKDEVTKLKDSKSTSNLSSNTSTAQVESNVQIRLLPATPNNLSDQDIKNEAFMILSEIHKIIEAASIKTSDLEVEKKAAKAQSDRYLMFEDPLEKSIREFIPQNPTEIEKLTAKITEIESEYILKFNQNYISKTIQIRNILVKHLPESIDYLPVENYIKLSTLTDLKDVEKDIEVLVQHI